MNHKQMLDKYIVERTNIKIVESNLNIIADRFIKLNEDAIRENRVDEFVPLLAAPLWAAAKFAGGQLLRHGATRLAAGVLKRGASKFGQKALSGMRKGWSMLRGKTGRGVGKEVAADTAADAGVQSMMPANKAQPNYLADLVASDKSGKRKEDDEMVESFLFEALENIFEEKKPGLFRRMLSGVGGLGKGILRGLASGFMKGAFGAEPSEKGGFLSRVGRSNQAFNRLERIKRTRPEREEAERRKEQERRARAAANVQDLKNKRAAKVAAKPLQPVSRSPEAEQRRKQGVPTGPLSNDPEYLKAARIARQIAPGPEDAAARKKAERIKKLQAIKNRTSTSPSERPLGANAYSSITKIYRESLITMGQKIVESMLMRIQEEDDDDDNDNIGSKKRKEALGSRKAGFHTKASARKEAKPLLKKNKGGKVYMALLQDPKKQTSAMPLNPRRGQGRKGKRSSNPSNRPDSLRGRFVNTSRGRTTDEEAAHQAALKAEKTERRKALVDKFVAMRNKK